MSRSGAVIAMGAFAAVVLGIFFTILWLASGIAPAFRIGMLSCLGMLALVFAWGMRAAWNSPGAKAERAAARAPVVSIAALAPGTLAKVEGRVAPVGPTLEAPLTGRRVVAFELEHDHAIREAGGKSTRSRPQQLHEGVMIELSDGSGRARVDLSPRASSALGMSFAIPPTFTWGRTEATVSLPRGEAIVVSAWPDGVDRSVADARAAALDARYTAGEHRPRFTERAIAPGDMIEVFGLVTERDGHRELVAPEGAMLHVRARA
jgi:hypothetical protein